MTAAADRNTTDRMTTCFFYPFVFIGLHLPLLLMMHRAKIGERGLQLSSAMDAISYYHADLVFYTGLAMLLSSNRWLRRYSTWLFLPFYYLAAFDWISWSVQSKAFFFADIYRSLQILLYYPEFFSKIGSGTKLKTAIVLIAPVFIVLLLHLRLLDRILLRFGTALNRIAATVAIAIFMLLPFTVSHSYILNNSLAFMLSEQLYARKLSAINVDTGQVELRLGRTLSSPDTLQPHKVRPDVILFIIETTPYPYAPNFSDLIAELDYAWLKNHSVVFQRHYSTYPASDRSTFSILSGKYPPMVDHNKWKKLIHYGTPLAEKLNSEGYSSHLFSSAPLSFYGDDVMHRHLGFSELHEIDRVKQLRKKTANGHQWDREGLYGIDVELIDRAQALIANQPADTPLFITIATQSSHAPFHCPPEPSAMKCGNDTQKIAANMRWQFKQLQRLLLTLDQTHRERIVIVTGDHGLRSEHESALFESPQVFQEATFHVPLLVADERLSALSSVNHMTSHVDIQPTVLDMTGIHYSSEAYHGRSLFTETPRTVYFVGLGYLPYDGFYTDGNYYVRNKINDYYLNSPEPLFTSPPRTPSRKTARAFIDSELMFLEAFLRQEFTPRL